MENFSNFIKQSDQGLNQSTQLSSSKPNQDTPTIDENKSVKFVDLKQIKAQRQNLALKKQADYNEPAKSIQEQEFFVFGQDPDAVE